MRKKQAISATRKHPVQWSLIYALLIVLLTACGGNGDQEGQVTTVTQATATGALTRVDPTTPAATVLPATAAATDAPPQEEPATPTSQPMATAAPPQSESTSQPAAAIAQPLETINLAPIGQGFNSPTYLTHAGDERLFVTEQDGRIQILVDGQIASEPFLDISDRVGFNSNEQGLLGLAFHPDYASNGFFFVDYTDSNGNTVVSRFQVSDDANRADPGSEQVLLNVQQPFPNHNGGQILFGPDGYFYVGLGDGGSGGDPQNNGQNPATLLGSILRLDVDGVSQEAASQEAASQEAASQNAAYAIPDDNPFVDSGGAPEVWVYGLRNPWRFSFDALDGAWYIADVGQNQYEEVHVLPAAQAAGANLGWNIMEGLHCYNSAECDQNGLLLPVAEYSHEQGGCSVTGGYVYRGAQFDELAGNYFFGDYCSGFIWALRQDEQGQWTTGQGALVTVDGQITSFGTDAQGEIYVVTREGVLYQLQP